MATRFFGGDNLSAIGIITALGLALSSFLFNDGQTRLANVDVTGQTPIANMQFGGYAVAARFHATSTASEWGVCQTSGGTSSTPTGINCYRPFEDSMFSMYAVSTTDGTPYPMMFQTPPWFTADYISFGYGLAGATGTHIAGGIFPFDDGENDVGFPGFNFRNGYFSSDVIVAGQSVCLEDGTNCPAGSGTPNLQQVLAQGNTATTSASFFGGITVGTSLTATGTFAVTGSATSTFAGTVSSTALFSTNGNITNLRFTGATGTDLAVTGTLLMPEGTLSQPGARFGAFPSSGIGAYPGNLLFFESGVLSLVLSDVLKEFRVPSTYSYSWSSAGDNLAAADTFLTRSGPGIISTNGSFRTGGSISSTNASVTGTVSVTSDVVVNGQSVCLEDGTNCPTSGGAQTLAQVTALGASATATLSLLGGYVAASSTVTSTFTVLGTTALLGNVGVGTANPEGKLHVSGAVNERLVLDNGMIISQKNTSGVIRNIFTLYSDNNVYFDSLDGGMFLRVGAGLNKGITVLNGGNVGIGTLAPSVALDVNGSVSSTNILTGAIYARTNNIFNIGSPTSSFANIYASGTAVIGNVTTTQLAFTSASGSSLLISGQSVCLSDGTNCPASGAGTITSSTWQYNLTNATIFPTTSTFDVLIGGNTTATAGIVLDGAGTSTFANRVSSTGFIAGIGTQTAPSYGFTGYGGGLWSGGADLRIVTNDLIIRNIADTGTAFRVAGGLATFSVIPTPASHNAYDIGFVNTAWKNIYASGTLFAVGGQFSLVTSTQATTTWLNVGTTARLPADSLINGTTVCLSNGTNCPAGSGVTTLQQAIAANSSATSTPTFLGGIVMASSTATGTLNLPGQLASSLLYTDGSRAVSSTSRLTVNGNTGSVTGTNIFASVASSTNLFSNAGTIGAFTSNNATIGGGTINATAIGGTTPAAGAFTGITLGTSDLLPTSNNGGQDIGSLTLAISNMFASGTASLANVVMRSGTSTVAFGFASGTVSFPAWHLGSDLDSGFYTTGNNTMALSLAGTKIVDCNFNGCSFGSGNSAPSPGTAILGGGLFVTNATMTQAWVDSNAGNTSTAQFGDTTGSGSRACIVLGDSDGSGFTYLTVNNGVQTFSTTNCR